MVPVNDVVPATPDATTELRSQPTSAPASPWKRYVAVGDSFTEGLWDPTPADDDRCRGWADRLAEILAARSDDGIGYANLAIRGKLLRPILVGQVPRALRLEPDLVSLVGGGNDLLRPNADPDVLARNLEAAVVRIRATGADVLLATGMDAADSPIIKVTRPRVAVYNSHIWTIARRHGAYVLDVWGMRCLRDWRMWSEDRIHLTPEGHRRMAQGALVALGQQPDDPDWEQPLEPLPEAARIERIRENAQWLRGYVYPWAQRRIRRQSSGDDRTAKQEELTVLAVDTRRDRGHPGAANGSPSS